jgi:hypothetical protein
MFLASNNNLNEFSIFLFIIVIMIVIAKFSLGA